MDYLIIVHLRRHASIQDQQSVSNDYKGYKKNEYKDSNWIISKMEWVKERWTTK